MRVRVLTGQLIWLEGRKRDCWLDEGEIGNFLHYCFFSFLFALNYLCIKCIFLIYTRLILTLACLQDFCSNLIFFSEF